MKAYVAVFASDGTFLEWCDANMEEAYKNLVRGLGFPNHVKAGGGGVSSEDAG